MKFVRVDKKIPAGPGAPEGTTTHAWYEETAVQAEENILAWATEADGGWDAYPVHPAAVEAFGGKKIHRDGQENAISAAEAALSSVEAFSGGLAVDEVFGVR